MADLSTINSNLASQFNLTTIVNGVGWLIAGVILVCGIGFTFWWWWNKKLFNKKTTDFELVGGKFEPTFRDMAKLVKLGKGGFVVLFLKKSKLYRIAYGARVGRNDYYFFIAPDGYPYNGMLGGDITKDGRVPVVTTNPLMRAQYTALEKQIDSLHGEKIKFWDKYGNWVMSLGFVVIIGAFAYLIYKEMNGVMGQFPALIDKMGILVDKVSAMVANSQNLCSTAKLTPTQ